MMKQEESAVTAKTPPPKGETCTYPDCPNQPRTARDGAGARPKYCGQPDPVTGRPHTALTAFRRRQETSRDGSRSAVQPDDLGRPVTMATARAAQLRDGIRADIQSLLDKLTGALVQLESTADPEAAEAQLETVQAEAAGQIADARAELARQTQRRQHAEADADEARAAGLEADSQLRTAETARAAAEQAATDAHAAAQAVRDAAEREIQAAREHAEAEIAATATATAGQIAASHAETEARIGQMRAERDAAIRVRDDALRQAEQADRREQAQLTRAAQTELDARAELDQVRADAERERGALRQGLEARIAALEETRTDLRARAERAEADAAVERQERTRLAGWVEELLAAQVQATSADNAAQPPATRRKAPARARGDQKPAQ